MKKTIYRRPDGKFTLRATPDSKPVSARLIHTRTIGDWNKVTYSKKRLESTRDKTRTQIYYVDFEQPSSLTDEQKRKVDAEFKRGLAFFTEKEGFLFGAYVELTKLGEIAIISV